MQLIRSVCTNMAFPGTREDIELFKETVEFLKNYGIKNIEFFHDGPNFDKIGSILSDNAMSGVFIGVIPSKERGLNLCSPENWKTAAEYYCSLMDIAQSNGICSLMLNSGKHETDVYSELDALEKSMEFLYEYAEKKNYSFHPVCEPGDNRIAAFQLLGAYELVSYFCTRMEKNGTPLYLTMDCAHSAEHGENFFSAVCETKKYCNHIHFANCYIKNSADILYGDSHTGYDYPDTEWTPETLSLLYSNLKKLYEGETLILAMEYLCREKDSFRYFDKMFNMLSFID